MIARIAILVSLCAIVAVVGNELSPVGLAWNQRWDGDIRARALRADVEPMESAQLLPMLGRSDWLLLDTRGVAAFRAGRLPGAKRLEPFESLTADSHIDGPIREARRVVAYCSSAYCEIGLHAARALREAGIERVALLVEGYDQWVLEGLPVERE